MADKKPETVGERILQMRDDFVLLVVACNAGGDFDTAGNAQSLVCVLNNFENEHNVTDAVWPPEGDVNGLKGLLQVRR